MCDNVFLFIKICSTLWKYAPFYTHIIRTYMGPSTNNVSMLCVCRFVCVHECERVCTNVFLVH